MSPAYSFRGTWTVRAPVARVQVLVDLERYPEWWPQVLAVAKVTDDDARVLCRSALPYTLDLLLHAERREPTVLETSLAGTSKEWSAGGCSGSPGRRPGWSSSRTSG